MTILYGQIDIIMGSYSNQDYRIYRKYYSATNLKGERNCQLNLNSFFRVNNLFQAPKNLFLN